MDAVTLGMAKADARKNFLPSATATTTETFAILTERLQRGTQDAVLQVLGDSTGVTITGVQTRWPWLVAQGLAALYPAYTVKYRQWNDTAQAYDADVTVQTGTGAFTLTVTNGSFSGSNVEYALARMSLMIPAAPTLTIVNYCHNAGGSIDYRSSMYNLTRLLEDLYPLAGIVLTAQNPKRSDVEWATEHLTRTSQVKELAASEGYGLVDAMGAFTADADYASNLLLSDGVHPNNTVGSPLWAAQVMQQFRKARNVVPRRWSPRGHRIWVPAQSFMANEGAPDLAIRNSSYPAFALDKDTAESIMASVDWPHGWQKVNAYVVWSVASGSGFTAGTNTIIWELGLTAPASIFNSPSAASTAFGGQGSFGAVSLTANCFNGSAHAVLVSRFAGFTPPMGRPIMVRLRRQAANASDTIAEDVLVRGMIFERAA